MKLPNSDAAWIPEGKLEEYLLSETHPAGSSKARFFRGLGFTIENAEAFGQALLEFAAAQHVAQEISTVYGTKYTVEKYLLGPAGERGQVRTVWIVEQERQGPRLVTAYPV